MLSESARMASAAEARFRIDAPNSKPRAVKVIALDRPSEAAIKRLSGPQWSNATFLTASSFAGMPGKEAFSVSGWLSDLAGRTKNLIDEVSGADLGSWSPPPARTTRRHPSSARPAARST